MKIDARLLKEGLADVIRASTPVTTLPILANVLFKSVNGHVKLAATNLEIGVVRMIPVASNADPVNTTVPARKLSDLVSLEKSDIEFTQSKKTQTLSIETGSAKTRLKGIDPDEFPPIPTFDPEKYPVNLTVNANLLREAIEQTIGAAAKEEARPVLNGIHFSLDNDKLTLSGVDGYHLARRTIAVTSKHTASAIIPSKGLKSVIPMTRRSPEVTIGFSRSNVIFSVPDTEIVSQVIEGTYPDIDQLIPTQFDITVRLSRDEFINAINRSRIVSATPIVRLDVKKDTLAVIGQGDETGDTNTVISAQVTGTEDFSIAFNSDYLLDFLRAIDHPEVELRMNQPSTPAIVAHPTLTDLLLLIMPMHAG